MYRLIYESKLNGLLLGPDSTAEYLSYNTLVRVCLSRKNKVDIPLSQQTKSRTIEKKSQTAYLQSYLASELQSHTLSVPNLQLI